MYSSLEKCKSSSNRACAKLIGKYLLGLYSSRRRRLASAQVVSYCVYEMPKQ